MSENNFNKKEEIKNSFENFFSDFSRLTGNLSSVAFESGKNLQTKVKESLQSYLTSLDFINREEFEVLKKLHEKSLNEIEQLKKEIAELKNSK